MTNETNINGWEISGAQGAVTLTKGDKYATAEYAHDDHELAFDHVVASAWEQDNPEEAWRLVGNGKAQWAAIVRWSGGKAGLRFGEALPGAFDESTPSEAPVNPQLPSDAPEVTPVVEFAPLSNQNGV